MPIIQVTPLPGQTPTIGYGTVSVFGPNLPNIVPGDQIMIFLSGQIQTQQEVGHMLPGESNFTFDGVMTGGSMPPIVVTATVAGSLASAAGLVVTNGVFPTSPGNLNGGQPGELNPFSSVPPCHYGVQTAPTTAPPPGLDALVAAINNSWTTHVAVASVLVDLDSTVSYMTSPPWASAPFLTTIPNGNCLKEAAAAKVAALLGGTVSYFPAVGWNDPFVYNPSVPQPPPQPSVAWVSVANLLGDGIARRAQGSLLVAAFDTRQTGQMRQNIINTFQPA